ncbi:subtilisin-like protease SBT1.7 [Nymphaea colorata]|uniref:subtilisin-like protease SBT1.7 n=1 Tax=Nymphaea colorata TaxID=210225 RepID=UPI00129DC421|nr:subtilisin-like protease SBT1.7 [Nymphaea colorata]
MNQISHLQRRTGTYESIFHSPKVTSTTSSSSSSAKKTYIVQTEHDLMPMSFSTPDIWHQSLLDSVSDGPTKRTIIYTYSTVLHGFSTSLTATEAESLRLNPGVLAVLPEKVYHPDTTRTPHFLGLDSAGGLLPRSKEGSDVIIGVLDTGIWPESRSFNDDGLGPIPSKWKGSCVTGKNFNASSCNSKLIGAQFFSSGYEAQYGPIDETKESRSPRDDDGHGTHTSSTAGGAPVDNAALFGYARGVALGMATRARIAAYKVCWIKGCTSSDILAAMDKAVLDGVDILSLSLSAPPSPFNEDTTAIGAFGAVQHGVLVSCAAGNTGPLPYTVRNVAPWIMTVGASSIDRDFPSYAVLGNGNQYMAQSLYDGKPLPSRPTVSLVYAGNVSNSVDGGVYCLGGTLDSTKVAGKVVLCQNGNTTALQKGLAVRASGGVGVILAGVEEDGSQLQAEAHFLPTVTVSSKNGDEILRYILSNPRPRVTIMTGRTRVGVRPSPVIASFSSRGPNSITPQILKPDVIAPGLNILAAWSGNSGPTGMVEDKRRVDFNIISGTSMSCPHVSGLAALLKGAHPNWSPAAIKSALMTTSNSTYPNGQPLLDSATGKPSSPLVHGAGHVVPQKALNPGLVYDITADDYLNFLCGIGYTEQQIAVVARRRFTCRKGVVGGGLNYPSFLVQFPVQGSGQKRVNLTRTVTNVGDSPSMYSVYVSLPHPVKAVVSPQVLDFRREGEMMSYFVTFTSSSLPLGTSKFGYLEWCDGEHRVRSPIVFIWV